MKSQLLLPVALGILVFFGYSTSSSARGIEFPLQNANTSVRKSKIDGLHRLSIETREEVGALRVQIVCARNTLKVYFEREIKQFLDQYPMKGEIQAQLQPDFNGANCEERFSVLKQELEAVANRPRASLVLDFLGTIRIKLDE